MLHALLALALCLPAEGDTTHVKTHSIEVDGGLQCFSLAIDGRLLAGCGGSAGPWGATEESASAAGEIRVLSSTGEVQQRWPCPVVPDAMAVDRLGSVIVAGGGELLRFDAEGKLLHRAPAPHALAMESGREALIEQTRAQMEAQAASLNTQLEQARKDVARLEEKPADQLDASEKAQLDQQRQMVQILEDFQAQNGVDIEQQVKSAAFQKLKVSSVACDEKNVFLTTQTLNGYTYDVWRTDDKFESGECIVQGLSGCCGQMDVRCDGDTLFVAENSRHRVARFDRSGKKLGAFGQGDRTGENGFLGCCNPMNLAFDRLGLIYAAESDGRVLRYSADGRALGTAADVHMPGGCKDATVHVSPDGKNLFLLDIQKGRIHVLNKKAQVGG